MGKKGLFFDFGGTIVTDESDHRLHLMMTREIVKRYRLNLTPEEVDAFFNGFVKARLLTSHEKWPIIINAYKNAFTILLTANKIHIDEGDLQYFENLYLRLHKNYTEPFPNAIDVLRELFSEFYMAIISDIDNNIIFPILEKLNILNLFKHITTSEEVGVGKPNPKIFEVALNKAGLKPENSVYIGNSLRHDVEGARKIGMDYIHFGEEVKNWIELKNEIIRRYKNGD